MLIFILLTSLKDKINNPPKDPDDQPIPKSLQKIMNLKKRFNSGDEEVRVKRKSKSRSGLISTESKKIKRINMSNDKSSANFTQLPGESSKAFLNRVNQTVKQYLKEAEFENKYGVNIKRSTETGQIIGVEQKPVDEFEQLLKKPSKELKKGKGKIKQTEPKLTKSQKRLKKLADKKERKELDRIDEFAKFADQVPFGEVATAPPTLPTPKKVSKTNLAPRVSIESKVSTTKKNVSPIISRMFNDNRRVFHFEHLRMPLYLSYGNLRKSFANLTLLKRLYFLLQDSSCSYKYFEKKLKNLNKVDKSSRNFYYLDRNKDFY